MIVSHPGLAEVRERARAALLGAAVGDALGATVEFLTPSEIRGRYGVLREMKGGGWLQLSPGQITDDTQMSLCVARSIAAHGFRLEDIAARFGAWLKSRPIDIGNTCRRGIRRYLNDGSLAGPPCEGDGGNGAVMRMAPVAIASLGDLDLMERWAADQAHITHHHHHSDAACVLVGRLLHLACTGRDRDHLLWATDSFLLRSPVFRFIPYHGLSTTYVVDTMQTVLHYLFSSQSFEECLVGTVNQGGDADTTAAIAGAIAGALYGPTQIPRRWLKKLDPLLVSELTELSDKLVDRSPLATAACRDQDERQSGVRKPDQPGECLDQRASSKADGEFAWVRSDDARTSKKAG